MDVSSAQKDSNMGGSSSPKQCGQFRQATTLCSLGQVELQAEKVSGNISSPKQVTSNQNHEFGSKIVNTESLQDNQVIATEIVVDGSKEYRKSECDHVSIEKKGTLLEEVTNNSCLESLRSPIDDLTRKFSHDQSQLPPGNAAADCNLVQSGPHPRDVPNNPGPEQLGPAQENAAKSPTQLGHKEKRTRGRPRKGENSQTSSVTSAKILPKKRKDTQRSSAGSTRSLRSRAQEKPKVPDLSNRAEEGVDIEKKRKKRKKRMEKSSVNEFSRIRTHLRYLLHRIKYEQNFIDAYSGEGWKGQSLEKIKPEKELQRAKSEILRRKLKIRDLFQRLDLSCAEGRLPEALFDSAGEIDSEDIFCAKCGSKDVAINNDIILCDGTCERGFHQFCLEPPLLKEHIPPDDEGWLCPGCDCKVDCVELLNDSQGTNLSVSDSWKKVFTEEAAAAAGNKLDDNFGLPSDDSEDDDYDPDGPELDEKVQGDEPSSDESDYYSASDDLGPLQHNEQSLELPSDDSEDDDYDPSGLDPEQEIKEESSSSDFTSDSEDFSVAFEDNGLSGEVQGPMTSTLDNSKTNEEGRGHSGINSQSLSDELFSLLESDPEKVGSAPIYPKRHVERLDYKKLHDEEYGNTSSDSSDEDFVDTSSPKRKKRNSGKVASEMPNVETPTAEHGKDGNDLEPNQEDSEVTHKWRTIKSSDVEGTNSAPSRSHKGSSAPGASGKIGPKSYGEDVTQRLFLSFQENQYPQRAVKETLARELALTVQQVSKWFDNARWSYRHSSHMASSVTDIASEKGTPHQKSQKLSGPEPNLVLEDVTCNGDGKKEKDKASPGVTECCSGDLKLNMATEEGSGQNSSSLKSKKRKAKFDDLATEPNTNMETPKQSAEINSQQTQEVRKSRRLQSKSIKPLS